MLSHSPLLAFGRRSFQRTLLAVAGVAALAACDNDRPVGPNSTAGPLPTSSALFKGPTKGYIKIVMEDKNQQQPKNAGAEYVLTTPGQPSITAIDNGAGDSDPTTGIVFVKGLNPGTYDVCEKVAPASYLLADPNCQTATVTAGVITPLSYLTIMLGRAAFRTIDYAMNYWGGAVFKLRDSTGTLLATIVDNSPPDLDPTPGRFELEFQGPEGIYSLCTVTPPAGKYFVSGNNACVGFQVTHGQYSNMPEFWVYPLFSAFWQVTDGTMTPDFFFVPIGPGSEFQITNPNGTFNATIVDNGVNDFDQRIGKLAIELPDAGQYTICQTVAVPGHQMSSPNCKRFEVVGKLVPAWLEFFINAPI